MDEEQTLKAIEVMQAFADGKSVEFRWKDEHEWRELKGRVAGWDWVSIEYRIKESTKPSINWDHVHPDYKYLFTDDDGSSYLVASKPTQSKTCWLIDVDDEHCVKAEGFASFIPGDCDWKESLVQRPESV